MKRFIIPIIIVIVAILNVNAQRVSTQQFLVRKITFQATDPIVPINGISVEINKAKFRSDKSGQFTANIPVSKDMGFYISSITARIIKAVIAQQNQYVQIVLTSMLLRS